MGAASFFPFFFCVSFFFSPFSAFFFFSSVGHAREIQECQQRQGHLGRWAGAEPHQSCSSGVAAAVTSGKGQKRTGSNQKITQSRLFRRGLLLLQPFYWPTPFTGLRADDRYIDPDSHTVVLIWYKRPEIKATGFALALRSHVEVDFISFSH